MKAKGLFFIAILAFTLTSFQISSAQFDPGVKDTCRIEQKEIALPEQQVTIEVWVYNDEEIEGFAIPLSFYHPSNTDIVCDSIHWSNRVMDNPPDLYASPGSDYIDSTAYRLNIWAMWFSNPALIAGEGPICTIYFTTGSSWDHTQGVVLDTTFYPPSNELLFVASGPISFKPFFVPGCLGGVIQVTSPNGGELWGVGQDQEITWSSLYFTNDVKIEYSTNSGSDWLSIEDITTNDGTYLWTIPSTPSTNCRVRVSDIEDAAPQDMSDADFTIAETEPFLVVSADTLYFGQVCLCTADTLQLVITNEGVFTLTVDSMVLDNDEYTVDLDSFSINPGENITIRVIYTPDIVGVSTGTLTIFSNAINDSDYEVFLQGEGMNPPTISLSQHEFADTLLAGMYSWDTLTIENSGDCDLTFTITQEGSNWYVYEPWYGTIPPHESAEVTIVFLSYVAECDSTKEGTFFIASNDCFFPEDTIRMSLTVIGVPDIDVSAEVLEFDSVYIGCEGEAGVDTAKFWIYSKGCLPLTVYEIVSDTADFWPCIDTLTVASGDSQEVCAVFQPSVGGWIQGKLSIISNDPDEDTLNIQLQGFGVGVPRIVLSKDIIADTVFAGDFLEDSILISNLGGSDLVFEITNLAGEVLSTQIEMSYMSEWYMYYPSSDTITPDGSIPLILEFYSSLEECDTLKTDTLIVSSNDCYNPVDTIPLSLWVDGHPDIAIEDTLVVFPETIYVGCEPDTTVISIFNGGCESLIIDQIYSDAADFIPAHNSLVVNPGDSTELELYFSPSTTGLIQGTLKFVSNDPKKDTVEVMLNGYGRWQPHIETSPDTFAITLFPGQDTTLKFTIINDDRGVLEFKINRVNEKIDTIGVVGYWSYPLIDRINNDDYLSTRYEFIYMGDYWTYPDIQYYDMIVVNDHYSHLSCDEVIALRDFYLSGKPIVLGVYGLRSESSCETDTICSLFGVKNILGGNFYPGYLNVSHPIAQGVELFLNWADGMDHFEEDGAEWIVAGSDNNYYVLAKDGIARTVIFGHAVSLWWDLYGKQLIRNAIDWAFKEWPWFHLDLRAGTVAPYDSLVTNLYINTAGFSTDSSYYDSIKISHNECDQDTLFVPVHLNIVYPWICSIPESVVVSGEVGEVDTTQILVSNCGSGTLIFGVDEDLDWIEVYPEVDSVSSGDTVSVDVVADFSDLLPGDYYVFLSIFSYTYSGDSFVVLFHYNVGPCPDIWVFPESLKIDSLYPGRYKDTTISLGNQGLGELWYQLSNRVSGNSAVYGLGGEPAHREYEQSYYGVALGKGEEDYRVGGEVIYDYGGPDNFGNHWIDSDDLEGPEFEWVEISRIGRRVEGLGLDNNVGPFYLGFSFPFYGEEYDSVRICSNGWLSFSSTQTSYTNQPLPYAGGPYDLLAVFWDDLDFTTGGDAYYFTDGRRFVVEYKEVSHFGGVGTYTFQVILYPDGRIKYQYLTMGDPKDKATVGIQNSDGTDGLEVVFNAPYLKDSLTVLISSSVPWLSISPHQGIIESQDTELIHLNFCGPSLDGEYSAILTALSNDCDEVISPLIINLTVHPCTIFYGDVNADCWVDVSDAVHILHYLFSDGSPPNPEQTGDVNCDGEVTIADVVYLINYLFKDGPPPCEPE